MIRHEMNAMGPPTSGAMKLRQILGTQTVCLYAGSMNTAGFSLSSAGVLL